MNGGVALDANDTMLLGVIQPVTRAASTNQPLHLRDPMNVMEDENE